MPTNNNELIFKLTLDGKEAIATLQLTDNNVRDLYQSFKYGKQEVNGLTTAISQGFNNAREIFHGMREAFNVLRNIMAEPIMAGAQLEVLKSNFKGTNEDIELFKKAVAGTVGEAGLIKLSNQATDLGLSLQQQAMLFSLAEDAGDKYGGSLEENFQKIVFASEGSSRGLKALGIQKEVYEAIVTSLAAAQGTTIDKLDAESQKQIRLQAILQASGTTIEDVKNKTADNLDKIQQSGVAYNELREKIGGALNVGFQPLLKALMDLYNGLNDIHPAITTTIGLVGTLGASFVALKVTGISGAVSALITTLIPALTQAKVAALGLNGALGLVGIAALGIAKLNSDLSGARELREKGEREKAHAQSFVGYLESAKKTAEGLKEQFNSATDAQLKQQINLRDLEIQKLDAKKESTKLDLVQIYLYQEEQKVIRGMIKERAALKVEPGKDDKKKTYTEFEKAQIDYQGGFITPEQYRKYLTQRLEVLKGSTYEEKQLIISLRNELEELNKKYTTVLPEIVVTPKKEGDTTQYKQKTGDEELTAWRNTEYTKVADYANATAMRKAIDDEYDIRKRQLDQDAADAKRKLDEETLNAQLSATSKTLASVGGLFAKHTAAYKLFASVSALIDAYQAAQAAYKSVIGIPVVGPVLAPIAYGAALAQGLATVISINSVKVPGYARGGAIVGENGMEIIAPAEDYATGMAELVTRTAFEVRNYFNTGGDGSGNSGLMNEVKMLREEIRDLASRPARAYFDNDEALKVGQHYDYEQRTSR